MNIQETLNARQKTHGDYSIHASITQQLKAVIHARCPLNLLPEHREALDMILHKIGRIVAGNARHEDHWHDIAGYAELARQACYAGQTSNPCTAESPSPLHQTTRDNSAPTPARHNDLKSPESSYQAHSAHSKGSLPVFSSDHNSKDLQR